MPKCDSIKSCIFSEHISLRTHLQDYFCQGKILPKYCILFELKVKKEK